MRCLITGGAGFIGFHLARTLTERGVRCLAYDDVSAPGGPERLALLSGVRLEQGDVRGAAPLAEAVRRFRPDWVVHLAAIHYIPDCERDPGRAMSVNVGGTQALLEACREVTPEVLVLASSGSVYAPSGAPVDEEARLGPIDVYGRTKLRAEEEVGRWQAETGARAVVARFFNVYGPRESTPHLIPEIMEQLRSGDGRLVLGNLDTRRDFIFVEDVVSALVTLLERGPDGLRVFNVGSGRASSGQDVIRVFEQLLGRELTVERDPARYRPSDRPFLAGDIGRLRDAVGWSPEVALAEGIRRTLAVR